MENRFGLKDVLLVALLLGVIGVILLAMLQYDRQFVVLQRMESSLRQQQGELAELNRTLSKGVPMVGTTQSATGTGYDSPKGNPFMHLLEVEAKPDFARGDWLVENFGVKFQRLTPLGTVGDLYTMWVQARMFEQLCYRDPYTLKFVPLLATDWEIKDNSAAWQAFVDQRKKVAITEAEVLKEDDLPPENKADERKAYVAKRLVEGRREADIGAEADCPAAIEIRLQLRRGVTFSDGAPFSADDVVFSFDWIMNKKVEAPRERSYLSRIKSVEKIDEYAVLMKFKEPYFAALSVATTNMQILSKRFYERMGVEKFNKTPGLCMGTGPYMMKDPETWTPGQKLELIRNERYWGERGTFDRLVFNEVEGESAEIVMLRNGQLDRLRCAPDQYVELLKDQNLISHTQHFEVESVDSGFTFVGWNEKRDGKPTIFADKRVRQAMTMLCDRERMARQIYHGYATVAKSTFSELSGQSDPNLKTLPYDPERAKSLLKEAGFEDRNGDGIIESPDGKPFRFKLTFKSADETSKKIALFLKDSYSLAGIVAEPDATDWNIMMKNVETRNFDSICMGWSSDIEDDPYQIFHSDQIADAGDNFISYINPEKDRLIESARRTVDDRKRLELWHQLERVIIDDQPYTFLLERKSLSFLDGRIANVDKSKLGLNYNLKQEMPVPWYVPKGRQKYAR
jgi:peptide/nickel transport system substrate-binding protein